MHVTEEEKLAIGKLVCTGELTYLAASKKYGVSQGTISNSVRLYRESIGEEKPPHKRVNNVLSNERAAYENMSKEELIDALILAKANELRAKKGYEVRGDGANKEFIFLYNENSK